VIVLYSPEGAGKTSFATNFRDATYAFAESETGLLHLMSKGLVSDCDHFPEFEEWDDLRDATREMVGSADRPKTFVVDTIGGAGGLLKTHICKTKYGGEMSKKGFLNFQEGFDAMVPDWRLWIADLERLRNKGTTVVLLGHAQTVNHKNPDGADYHRYVPELHPKIWSPIKKFADIVIHLDYHTEVVGGDAESGKTGTGQGGATRVYHFERSAAHDAKNRHGLPSKMLGQGTHAEDFAEFVKLVKAGEVTAKTKTKPKPKPVAVEPEAKPAE
jgi:hypothetical protein